MKKGVLEDCMKDTIKTNNELDNYGTLTESMPSDIPTYDFRKIKEYCKKHNKTLSDITEKELEQFLST